MCAPEGEGAEREFAFVAKRRYVVGQASAATHGVHVPETLGTRGIGNCLTVPPGESEEEYSCQ